MHHFRGERDSRKSIAPSRTLWTALRALNRYLIGQSAWLVNYAERHRAGLRVGTAITEGIANFLVNRRMNKRQQMRWLRRGVDLLLQIGRRIAARHRNWTGSSSAGTALARMIRSAGLISPSMSVPAFATPPKT